VCLSVAAEKAIRLLEAGKGRQYFHEMRISHQRENRKKTEKKKKKKKKKKKTKKTKKKEKKRDSIPSRYCVLSKRVQ